MRRYELSYQPRSSSPHGDRGIASGQCAAPVPERPVTGGDPEIPAVGIHRYHPRRSRPDQERALLQRVLHHRRRQCPPRGRATSRAAHPPPASTGRRRHGFRKTSWVPFLESNFMTFTNRRSCNPLLRPPTSVPISAALTGRSRPRTWPAGRRPSGCRRWRSPIATGSTARRGSPRPVRGRACGPSSVRRSRSACGTGRPGARATTPSCCWRRTPAATGTSAG